MKIKYSLWKTTQIQSLSYKLQEGMLMSKTVPCPVLRRAIQKAKSLSKISGLDFCMISNFLTVSIFYCPKWICFTEAKYLPYFLLSLSNDLWSTVITPFQMSLRRESLNHKYQKKMSSSSHSRKRQSCSECWVGLNGNAKPTEVVIRVQK